MTETKRARRPKTPTTEPANQAEPEVVRSPLIPMLWVLGPLFLLVVYAACS